MRDGLGFAGKTTLRKMSLLCKKSWPLFGSLACVPFDATGRLKCVDWSVDNYCLCCHHCDINREKTLIMANTISFAIPGPIVEYIDNRVATGGYGNRSEYIRDLVRMDQLEQSKRRLRELVTEGLASGSATPMTAADWTEMEAVARGEVRA
jgi:antitoxin ParD1/3/4